MDKNTFALYPTGYLKNIKTNRWHPILFRPGPLPGDSSMVEARWKSKGHHTIGFDTLEQAKAHVAENPDNMIDIDAHWEWDAEKEPIPAMVIFLPKKYSNGW